MIPFEFNIRKAVESASRFLELSEGSISIVRLMKLLYLADRESIAERGHPILGDSYTSMEHGPVVSVVYDLCKKKSKGTPERRTQWLQHFRSDGREIRLVVPAQVAALSRKDLEILDAVFEKWKGWDTWDLVEHLHRTLPEWKDPGKSSRPIALKTLCSVLGMSPADMQSVEEQARLSRT